MLRALIQEFLSTILLPLITLFGFFYIAFGKPRNRITHVYTRNRNSFFISEGNLTKKVLQVIFYIIVAYFILEFI